MNNNEFENLDFNTDFTSDAEVSEALDNLIVDIAKQIAEEDSKTAIVNPYRVQQVLYTYKVLKYLTRGTGANVSYELHKPYKSVGCVSVIGFDLQFTKMEWFLKAIELASNFEVYPRTDGTIQMNFGFHGLTTAVE